MIWHQRCSSTFANIVFMYRFMLGGGRNILAELPRCVGNYGVGFLLDPSQSWTAWSAWTAEGAGWQSPHGVWRDLGNTKYHALNHDDDPVNLVRSTSTCSHCTVGLSMVAYSALFALPLARYLYNYYPYVDRTATVSIPRGVISGLNSYR